MADGQGAGKPLTLILSPKGRGDLAAGAGMRLAGRLALQTTQCTATERRGYRRRTETTAGGAAGPTIRIASGRLAPISESGKARYRRNNSDKGSK
jgi:hypothetical protein